MYVGPNYGGSHLLLLGGSAAQQANNQMDLGQETHDLFNRPISSAQAIIEGIIEAFPENAEGPAARDGALGSRERGQTPRYSYDDWIEKANAFRNAANTGLGKAVVTSASGVGQGGIDTATTAIDGASTGTSAATGSTADANPDANPGGATESTANAAPDGDGGDATSEVGGSSTDAGTTTSGGTETGTSTGTGTSAGTGTSTGTNTGTSTGTSSGGGLLGALLGGLGWR